MNEHEIPDGPLTPRGASKLKFDLPTDISRAVEMAYRRGFYQGAIACWESAQRGHTLASLSDWLHRLLAWRQRAIKGVIEFPEWPAR
jgi:hypothetical protein